MKTVLLLTGLLAVGAPGKTWAQLPGSVVQLVEQQVAAYNAHDIEAFLAPYADSVTLYTFPNRLLSKGKDVMRQRYVILFSRMPKLHCQITGRLVEGNTVIDQELLTGVGDKPLTSVAIYQIEGGKINKVYFVH